MFCRRTVVCFFRWLASVVVSVLLVFVLVHSDEGRVKGTPVPFANLASILVFAFVAAVLTRRFWNAVSAPFAAGIAGSFGSLDVFCGPYGGAVGLLVGILVALLPMRFIPRPTSRST